MSKLIHAVSLSAFKSAFPYWERTDIDGTYPNPSYKTIVYTDDGYLYTHGKIFQMAVNTGGTSNDWFTANLLNYTLTLKSAGTTQTVTLPIIGLSTDTSTDLNITTNNSVWNINHKNDYNYNAITVGPQSITYDFVNVPYFTTSTGGHTYNIGQTSVPINKVLQTFDNTTNLVYLLSGTSPTTTNSGTVFNTSLKANLSNGALYATVFYENENSLSSIYTSLTSFNNHTAIKATGSSYGHVVLQDTYDTTNDANHNIAATPKAVYSAYIDAINHADSILGANDAMVFKGTLGTGGTITTLPTTGYSAGWTYKVIGGSFTFGSNVCESGDLIICIKDFNSSYSDSDWTVAQTNIDGAVTSINNLTSDNVILGGGTKTIKSLDNGSDGTILKLVSGKPTWSADLVRQIQIDGVTMFSSSDSTALNFTSGTNIVISNSFGNLNISTTGLVTSSSLQSLNFTGKDTESITRTITYTPTSGNTITFDNDLYLSSTGHIGHRHNITSLGTKTLGKISYDSNGHITDFEQVSSLPNPNAFSIKIKGGTTELTDLYTYDGSYTKILNITSGSNITLTATNTGSNSGELNISAHDTVGKLAIGATGTTINGTTSNGDTYLKFINNGTTIQNSFNIMGSGATSVSSDSSGNINISSSNTWRNVTAYLLSNNTSGTILSNSISTADLDFGSEFLWDAAGGSGDGQLRIGWAEIASDGTITYTV